MLYHNWVRNLSWYNQVVNSSLVEFISKVTLWITLWKNPANEKRRLHQMHLAKEIMKSCQWNEKYWVSLLGFEIYKKMGCEGMKHSHSEVLLDNRFSRSFEKYTF